MDKIPAATEPRQCAVQRLHAILRRELSLGLAHGTDLAAGAAAAEKEIAAIGF